MSASRRELRALRGGIQDAAAPSTRRAFPETFPSQTVPNSAPSSKSPRSRFEDRILRQPPPTGGWWIEAAAIKLDDRSVDEVGRDLPSNSLSSTDAVEKDFVGMAAYLLSMRGPLTPGAAVPPRQGSMQASEGYGLREFVISLPSDTTPPRRGAHSAGCSSVIPPSKPYRMAVEGRRARRETNPLTTT
jgi:hypothetical protein